MKDAQFIGVSSSPNCRWKYNWALTEKVCVLLVWDRFRDRANYRWRESTPRWQALASIELFFRTTDDLCPLAQWLYMPVWLILQNHAWMMNNERRWRRTGCENDKTMYIREWWSAVLIVGTRKSASVKNSTMILWMSSEEAVESTSLRYCAATASATCSIFGNVKYIDKKPAMMVRAAETSSFSGSKPNIFAKKSAIISPSSLLQPIRSSTWLCWALE